MKYPLEISTYVGPQLNYARLRVNTMNAHHEVIRAGVVNVLHAVNTSFDVLNFSNIKSDVDLCGKTGKTRTELLAKAREALTDDKLGMPPSLASMLINALIGMTDDITVAFEVEFGGTAVEAGHRSYSNFRLKNDSPHNSGSDKA